MATKNHGRTRSGEVITDTLLEELAAKAEAGFDVDEILRRRGLRWWLLLSPLPGE